MAVSTPYECCTGVHTLQGKRVCISLAYLEGHAVDAPSNSRCLEDSRTLLEVRPEMAQLPEVRP